MHEYNVELTDTFGGEANYAWCKRACVVVPEWSHFKGWEGNGRVEPKGYKVALMRAAKKAMGLTGVRGKVEAWGDTVAFYPYGMRQVMFITYAE